MTIDRFTKSQFEDALPTDTAGNQLWRPLSIVRGEHTYTIPVPKTNKRIVIRSSVRENGVAASTGSDSIRHWVEYYYKGQWRPLSKDTKAYTTRQSGWDTRLLSSLRRLWVKAVQDSKSAGKYGKEYEPNLSSQPEESADSEVLEVGIKATGPNSYAADDSFSFLKGKDSDPFDAFGGEDAIDWDAVSDDENGDPGAPASGLPHARRQERGSYSLNELQQQAVEACIDTPLRILAPPGSGKTVVLCHRYSHLLAQGVDPESIVAVTFSRDMADELLARIIALNPSIQGTDAEKGITTIHALCYRILRAEGCTRRIPDKFWKIKAQIQDLAEVIWPHAQERPGWKEIYSFINIAKFKGLRPSQDDELFGQVRDKFDNAVGGKLHDVRSKFDAWLERNDYLTFPDMLYLLEVLFEDEPLTRLRWQKRVQYVMVDEGQDTSRQAMRILTLLAEPQNQLTIVGDADQLCYRFAGATPDVNLYGGFDSRYPDGTTIKLSINYRSTKAIIDTCSHLISNNYGEGRPYATKYQKDVVPRPDAPQGDPVSFEMLDSPSEEAVVAVKQVQTLLDQGYSPDDFFIGVRTRAQTAYLERPLLMAEIPYINLVGSSFFGMRHTKDVISYLRLAFNNADSDAFQRVYRIASINMTHPWGKHKGEYCHHRYLGNAFLEACTDYETHKPMYKWVHSAASKRRAWRPGIDDLTVFMTQIEEVMSTHGPGEAIAFIIDYAYQAYLRAEEGIVEEEGSGSKLADLHTLTDIASEYESTAEFLKYASLAEKAAEAKKGEDWTDHLVVSTIHRLKGQERPVVIGLGFSEGVDAQSGPCGLLPHTYSMRPPTNFGILPTSSMGRVEDERCLAFVLTSRAQERVYLFGTRSYRNYTMYTSRFIREMRLNGRE